MKKDNGRVSFTVLLHVDRKPPYLHGLSL